MNHGPCESTALRRRGPRAAATGAALVALSLALAACGSGGSSGSGSGSNAGATAPGVTLGVGKTLSFSGVVLL